ncbi:MAG: hypothetical protein R3F42_00615 [Pseudomonadota bacterium]
MNGNAACGWTLVVMLALTGPAAAPAQEASTPVADRLWYEEQEAGTDPYPVRITVSSAYLRIDDDDDQGDFVLLDRAAGTVYSVSHDERTILEIRPRQSGPGLPDDLVLDAAVTSDQDAPAIAGHAAVLVDLTANGASCYHVAAVPGLLEAAVAGMADYARVLGRRQAESLQTVPQEIQTPCFLARYVYAPDRYLRYGLPIQEWDGAGYRRALVDFRGGVAVDAGLFTLPADYRRVSYGAD